VTRGRVHNVKEVDMMQRQQRQQRRRRRCDVRGHDVTNVESNVVIVNNVVTWRDIDDRVMDWRRLRSDFMANPAKIFITIWFESYIVVSQAFQTLDKNLDLNSMFLKVEK
jgi:hypothetical protein